MSKEPKIIINGRSYDGVEQLPPELRHQYWQAMASLKQTQSHPDPATVVHQSFEYGGKVYTNPDDLPPEIRELLQNLPAPTADGSEVVLKTTRILPPEVRIISDWASGDAVRDAGSRRLWTLVIVLSLLTALFLFLWLAGVRPPRWK